jgi:hypothetical protein
VGLDQFEFDREAVTGAAEEQRRFLDLVQGAIRRLLPGDLDLANTRVSIENGSLFVWLPHRHHDDQIIAARVGVDEAVVYFGLAHEHFWSEDPAHGRVWPVDALGHITAAFRLVEAVLLGLVELEIHEGFLTQHVKSYLIDDTGERTVISRSGRFRFRRHKAPPIFVRFDFGIAEA